MPHVSAIGFTGTPRASNICQIIIEGCEAKALIDTGAGISLISDRFRLASPILKRKKLNTDVRISASSVNNEPVKLKGTMNLDVKIGSLETTYTFYVTEQMSNPVILGWNFLQNQGLT